MLILANLLFYFRFMEVVKAQEAVAADTQQSQQENPSNNGADAAAQIPDQQVELPPQAPIVNNSNADDFNRTTFKGVRTFLISAYYSPVQGQQKYVTGSFSGDIRLNGGGVHGADGTPVYAGMIAAPKGYPFGTKMKIPGIGTVAVHDRGGAIVHSGQRGNQHDRLDVWMGYGDAGLKRALRWGKRAVDVQVYGIDPSIAEQVVLEGFSQDEKFAVNAVNTAQPNDQVTEVNKSPVSDQSLSFGNQGEPVAKLQKFLKDLNYYQGQINSIFDQNTLVAVTKFQIDTDIVNDENDYGAGYAGPRTMKVLAEKLSLPQAKSAEENLTPVVTFTRDLKPGDSGEDVRRLQQELIRLNLLGIETTGFYGDVTEHAVFKYQQIKALAGDKNSQGAGIFGPKTRETLNNLIAERERLEKLVATKKPDEE